MSEENARSGGTIKEKVLRMYEDMYLGRGPSDPSMTTRMALMEDCIEKIARNLNKAVWLLTGTFLTGVATVIITISLRK